MPDAKTAVGAVSDDDGRDWKRGNLNNGPPDTGETQSQKNVADDSKELADGGIAELSGEDSKVAYY